MNYPTIASSQTFSQRIERECIIDSAIAPSIYEAAVEINEDTGFWEPNRSLNHKVSTQWKTRSPHSFGAIACLMQEDGVVWQGKPDQPRTGRDGKLIKYEYPLGQSVKVYLPPVPPVIRQQISQRYGVNFPSDGAFWEFIEQHPEIPIVITEGGKKNLCLLSAGYAAIALVGVNGGYRTKDSEGNPVDPYLIPDLQRFAVPGRRFVFAFDRDEKPETVRKVMKAKWTLGQLLQAQGCEVVDTHWHSSEGKGIDDFRVNQGEDRLHETLATWLPLEKPLEVGEPDRSEYAEFCQWEEDQALAEEAEARHRMAGQGFKPDKDSNRQRHINHRGSTFFDFSQDLKRDFKISEGRANLIYEGYAPTFKLAPTIALQGWLGSGKTEATLRSLLPHRNCPIVWIAPTNGLLRQTEARAKRMGFKVYLLQDDNFLHRQMLRTGQPGLYLACPDSFKTYAVERVRWKETILVIDECSGVRGALLNKPVELPQITTAIKECASLIAVDALLGDIDLEILAELRGQPIKRYQQQFQKSQKPIKWLEGITQEGIIGLSHDGLYYPLLRQWILKEGIRKLAIAVDSVNAARQLRHFIESLGTGLKVWLACSHTVEENHQFLPDPDRLIADQGIDVLIYSPTIQSGADIQSSFERGLLIAGGVLPPKQMLQMLGRCRNCAEWFVSAPRKSINPACTTPSLDGKKVKRWGDQLSSVFAVVGVNAPQTLQSWGLWQRLVGEVEGAFSSEYLELLLHEYFESIKTVQIKATECGQWRNDRKQLKAEDAKSTLKANLQNGLRLLNEQKAPSKNSEVWDLKLADLAVNYPRVIKDVIASEDSQQEEAANLIQLFSSHRLERLKYWVLATDENPDDEVALVEAMRSLVTTYSSRQFKAFQFVKLFRLLNLERLVQCQKAGGKGSAAIKDKTHFDLHSPLVQAMWELFQSSYPLRSVFLTVGNIEGFWAVVRQCLRFLGYQGEGCTMRVATEELHPNGKDRRGKQRFSSSQSRYFNGWVMMECSGNSFFQEKFELIVEAIRDRLEQEREERTVRKDRGRWRSPPAIMAA